MNYSFLLIILRFSHSNRYGKGNTESQRSQRSGGIRPPFFHALNRFTLNGKRCKCLCTCEFSTFRPPPKPEKSRLLGPAPNPAEPRAKLARSSARLVASHSLSLLFLIFLLPGQAEQIINVCFCRCDFPHIFPGRPVLGV